MQGEMDEEESTTPLIFVATSRIHQQLWIAVQPGVSSQWEPLFVVAPFYQGRIRAQSVRMGSMCECGENLRRRALMRREREGERVSEKEK